MTAQDIANELLREWQECDADELKYLKKLTATHLAMNADSDRATSTYDDNIEAPGAEGFSHAG